MPHRRRTVLLVEDNEEDAFLLRRAFRLENVDCDLHVAEDGQQAIDYLSGTGKFSDREKYPAPTVMLLDLKLPYVNGLEVLAWLQTQPAGKDLKVIVLTSSGEDYDRDKAERFGIRGYYVKPPTPELVAAVVKTLDEVTASTSS
jgi:CheY-like chemotaxis protein